MSAASECGSVMSLFAKSAKSTSGEGDASTVVESELPSLVESSVASPSSLFTPVSGGKDVDHEGGNEIPAGQPTPKATKWTPEDTGSQVTDVEGMLQHAKPGSLFTSEVAAYQAPPAGATDADVHDWSSS